MKSMYKDKELEYIIGETLLKNNLTVSTAESCTGGMVAAKLISYPGISASYLEGAILKYGAVSEQTAKEMANGIARVSESKAAISTTGLAGPGGGSAEKPVGLVYIGVHLEEETVVKKFNFSGERDQIRKETTVMALTMLKDLLEEKGYL